MKVWVVTSHQGGARRFLKHLGTISGSIRRAVQIKPLLRVQFLLTLGGRGEEQETSALLSKKGEGREGSIESQQKFDFFCFA